MGSPSRALKRQKQKNDYQKFAAAWNRAKRIQAEKLSLGLKLEEPQLGRRPTFKMWAASVEKMKRQATESDVARQAEEAEKIDTSWEEPKDGSSQKETPEAPEGGLPIL